ncbi:MAG: hypothetical protein ABJA67_03410 [Chthonomonadales bacterium]
MPTSTKLKRRATNPSCGTCSNHEQDLQRSRRNRDGGAYFQAGDGAEYERSPTKDVGGNLQDIADIYQAASNLDKSGDYDKQAATVYEKIDAREELVRVLKRLAGNYKQQGRLDKMKKVLMRADRIMAKLHPRIGGHAAKLAKKVFHNEGLDGSEEIAASTNRSDIENPDKSDATSIKASIDEGNKTRPGEDET